MRLNNKLIAGLALGIVMIGATLPTRGIAVTKRAGSIDQARLNKAESEPQNWLSYGGTNDEQRFVTLNTITPANVGQLGLSWSYEFDSSRGQEATPLVVDGVMYVSSAWSKVHALDARTGKLLWSFDPHVDGGFGVYACCDVVNRGVAVWKGRVFVGTIDGRLIAIDATTGKQSWSVQTTDRTKPLTITGAPRVFHDKVVIGNGGADLCCARGYVTAYDTASGRQIWRFYTVPGNPADGPDQAASDTVLPMMNATWAGKWWEHGGGGTVWDTIVYDRELNQLYVGVGNGTPWNRKIRSDGKGDNLFLGSVVALDPDTGKYLWHYQESPGDSWDYTSTAPMMLSTLMLGGEPRKVIMHAPKNGFFYVIDRKSGKLLSAKNFVPTTWADRIDLATGRPNFAKNAFYEEGYFIDLPSSLGAHSWHPMSYSPKTGLVYIPAMQRPAIYAQDPNFKFVNGRWSTGVTRPPVTEKLPEIWGALIAWDPIAQKEVWRVPQGDMWNGGTLATASNIVFAGNGHGEFNAYSATDGRKLWGFDAHAGVLAGPMSYVIGGQQYIAVLAGNGGAYSLSSKVMNQAPRQPPLGRLLVFKIGGNSKLPAYDPALPPPNPSSEAFPPEQIAVGERFYAGSCRICHGGSTLPDLRRSGALPDHATWNSIVIGGALSQRGMASFARWLKPEDAEAIRAYMNQQATVLQKERQP